MGEAVMCSEIRIQERPVTDISGMMGMLMFMVMSLVMVGLASSIADVVGEGYG